MVVFCYLIHTHEWTCYVTRYIKPYVLAVLLSHVTEAGVISVWLHTDERRSVLPPGSVSELITFDVIDAAKMPDVFIAEPWARSVELTLGYDGVILFKASAAVSEASDTGTYFPQIIRMMGTFIYLWLNRKKQFTLRYDSFWPLS